MPHATRKRFLKSKPADTAATGGAPCTAEFVQAFRTALFAYYDTDRRALPWRSSSDPYCIWISEIMLQQTRVLTVIPYFERWLDRFPNVNALATADPEDVLKCWEGLGYYSRARNAQSAARLIRERHQGQLPASVHELRALPGIGEYTAAAIASIAYGIAAPAIDGNLRRVLARVFDEPTPRPAWLRERACQLLNAGRPGDFNQALMDLGATICTPRSPSCSACPLHSLCAARACGTVAERPSRTSRPPKPQQHVMTLLAQRADGRVLIRKRPRDALLGGLWEFPGRVVSNPNKRAAVSAARELFHSFSQPVRIGRVQHAFTHMSIAYTAFLLHVKRVRRSSRVWRWVTTAELEQYALPRAQRRLQKLLL